MRKNNILGYARVSTDKQELDRQLLELNKFGCDRIFSDVISGAKFERKGLNELLEASNSGDTIVVTQLDRLGRSLKELLGTIEQIEVKGCNFVSISQNFDTRTISGKLLYSILGAIAEFERSLLIERINQGITSAKQNGVKFGRKPVLSKDNLELAVELREQGKSINTICKAFNISRKTYYNRIYPHLQK